MVSEREIEAAMSGWHRALIDAPDESVYERRRRCIRAALEAAARVRAEDNAMVKALEDALRRLLKAYENAFDWTAELPPETIEAERIANEVLHTLASSKPEQPVANGKVDARIENTDGKKWRVESNDGKWTIQPEGQITADEARALCERILSALTADKPHPDDEAVDRFAAAMKAKLKWEREERGRHGWNDPSVCSEEYLSRLLVEHLAKGNEGNFEDIANLCMMLHQRGAHPRVLADALTAGKPEQSTIGTLRKENEALADALRGVLKAYENAFEWYDYLLSEHIDQKEAERRLRLLRQVRRAAPAAGGSDE